VGLAKRINASVDKMKQNSVLRETEESGRFEISPVLRLVFDAAQVQAVTAELRALLASGDRLVEDDDESEGDES